MRLQAHMLWGWGGGGFLIFRIFFLSRRTWATSVLTCSGISRCRRMAPARPSSCAAGAVVSRNLLNQTGQARVLQLCEHGQAHNTLF